MTLAIEKLVGDLAMKVLRGEDIEADIEEAFNNLSEMERRILIHEGLTAALTEAAEADPCLEVFVGENGEAYIRRAAA